MEMEPEELRRDHRVIYGNTSMATFGIERLLLPVTIMMQLYSTRSAVDTGWLCL